MSTQEIQTRINAERERLMAEEQRELALTADRAGPLEAGNDKALDEIEQQINESRSLQLRIIERIELLTKRLGEEEQRELSTVLDAKEAAAQRARELGEKLIRTEYAKQAKALATTLAKLDAIDHFINETRADLSRFGRDTALEDSNACRHIRPRRWTETVIKRVSLTEPQHPYYGKTSYSGSINHGANPVLNVPGEPGVTTTYFVDLEIEEERHEHANWARPLYDEAHLPAINVTDPALWTSLDQHARDSEYAQRREQREHILAELGLTASQ